MIEKTNELVEKLCKLAYVVIVKVAVPGVIVPKTLASYFAYFTTDANRDAFELSIPMW